MEKTYRFRNLRKNSLPCIKCVLRLSWVVHGPIYGRFNTVSCSCWHQYPRNKTTRTTFAFFKHWNSQFCLFQTLQLWTSPFSKHWNYQFCLFLNIGILNFAFSKHWNSQFCHFYKHWNYKFCLFETLEFSILPFRNIGILSLPFSKYKVTNPFVTLKNRNVLRPLERKQPIVDGC